jgi:uncharacterized GH25 family protein
LTLAGSLIAAAGARGHDFWIEPSTFAAKPNELVMVSLRVGDDLEGEPVPRDRSKIRSFVAAGPQGETPVIGRDGSDPAGLARPTVPGAYVLGYQSERTPNALAAKKFEHYLYDEGLGRIVELRQQRGHSAKEGREVYSRCAKSLVTVGEPPSTGYDRALGFTLELIAESNPWTLAPNEPLIVRLLHEGKPIEGVLITALHRDTPETGQAVRSSADGRARITLDRPGRWMIKAVHMVEAPPDAEADWESFWASLTLETQRNAASQTKAE